MSIEHMRSNESASTPISKGGYRYDPADEEDSRDFAGFDVEHLRALEREQGFDFSRHPAVAEN